jgi:hypothetical protein
VARTINAKENKQREPKGFPATMYIFTNYPHHYGDSDHPDPQKTWVSTLVKNPRYAFGSENVVHEINKALNQYGNIPNEFDQNT